MYYAELTKSFRVLFEKRRKKLSSFCQFKDGNFSVFTQTSLQDYLSFITYGFTAECNTVTSMTTADFAFVSTTMTKTGSELGQCHRDNTYIPEEQLVCTQLLYTNSTSNTSPQDKL